MIVFLKAAQHLEARALLAPHQCYPGQNITVKTEIEALEGLKNVSVTLFLWSSKSEGATPWSASFTVLDIADFSDGTVQEESCTITIPLDVDPGLIYGILSLYWSVYRSILWKDLSDKASFRVSYVKNKNYEDLQATFESALVDLQIVRNLVYVLLVITIALTAFVVYIVKRKTHNL